jgi:hypothetical protein
MNVWLPPASLVPGGGTMGNPQPAQHFHYRDRKPVQATLVTAFDGAIFRSVLRSIGNYTHPILVLCGGRVL